jgi:predicted nucleotidyltransferase
MEFETFLKRSDRSRKIFGKKELEIIYKQLQGLNLTQSEKNRLSRDIRPKFKFIEECSRFHKDFDIKKNKSNNDIIKKTVEEIINHKFARRIKKILLFGSFADNTFIKRSDIDICVIFKDKISSEEATKFRIRISGMVSEKVDIQVFNILPKKIKDSIIKNNKILFEEKDFKNIKYTLRGKWKTLG